MADLKNIFKEEVVDEKTIRRKTIIALSILIAFLISCIIVWKYIRKQPDAEGVYKPLRKVLNANEKIFTKIYSNNNLIPEYTKEMAAKEVRVNGNVGLNNDVDSSWRLYVIKGEGDTLELSLNDIKSLPKRELIFDFKCVEGWSQISHWGGTRLIDFLVKYNCGTKDKSTPDLNHPERLYKYIGMETPDGEYYVGLDMASCLHPQTLLCYEMNSKTLPMNQGFPLRLIIPVKYGIKSIKRIGTIFFSDTKPPDYWGDRGYDYFAGL